MALGTIKIYPKKFGISTLKPNDFLGIRGRYKLITDHYFDTIKIKIYGAGETYQVNTHIPFT